MTVEPMVIEGPPAPEALAPGTSEPPPTEALAPGPSPVGAPPPIHAGVTIRAWFSDVFNNLIATGRVREAEAESYLQDLLRRLGL